MLAGCETQTDWYQVPNDQQFDRLVGLGEDQRHIAAHNVHDKTRCQPGGTLIAASQLPINPTFVPKNVDVTPFLGTFFRMEDFYASRDGVGVGLHFSEQISGFRRD